MPLYQESGHDAAWKRNDEATRILQNIIKFQVADQLSPYPKRFVEDLKRQLEKNKRLTNITPRMLFFLRDIWEKIP